MDYISESSKEWCEVEGVIIFTPNVTFKSPLFKEETNPWFGSTFQESPYFAHGIQLSTNCLKREDDIPILSK